MKQVFIFTILTPIIVFLLIPIYMIGLSPSDYGFTQFNIFFRSSAFFSLIVLMCLFAIILFMYLCRFRKAVLFFSSGLFYWCFTAGLIFPVTKSAGMIDPEYIPTNTQNLFMAIITVIILTVCGLSKHKKYVYAFVLTVFIVSVPSSIFNILSSEVILTNFSEEKADQSLTLSGNKNIVVVSFDGIPNNIFLELLEDHEQYREAFKDFRVFENVVAQSPATEGSIMGELYGVLDYKSIVPGSILLTAKNLISEGYFENTLASKVEDLYQYHYYESWSELKRINVNKLKDKSQMESETFDFFRYPLARIFGANFLKKIVRWDKNIKPFEAKFLSSSGKSDLVARFKNHKGYDWDKKHLLDLSLFDGYTKQLALNDSNLSVRFMHLAFTHYPVDLDAKCDYRSDDLTWYKGNQNETGLRNQTSCALDKFIDYLNKLKSLGIYDDSLIVFKSDHGEPVTYFSEEPDNLKINHQPTWGFNRYKPSLMIKGINESQLEYKPIQELVLLNDLAKTLCLAGVDESECGGLQGVNLLAPAHEFDLSQPYYVYVPKDKNSTFRFKDMISIQIPSRNVSLLEGLEKNPKVVLSGSELPNQMQEDEMKKRVRSIEQVSSALERYKNKYGSYPKSEGFDGICSKWGKSSDDYIEGLVPYFLERLPVDSISKIECGKGYLYRSNGKDYKFIMHRAPPYDMDNVKESMVDRARSTYAYGMWSEGAKNW